LLPFPPHEQHSAFLVFPPKKAHFQLSLAAKYAPKEATATFQLVFYLKWRLIVLNFSVGKEALNGIQAFCININSSDM
jgi:hypothetical protein